jgi:hypothetical protein
MPWVAFALKRTFIAADGVKNRAAEQGAATDWYWLIGRHRLSMPPWIDNDSMTSIFEVGSAGCVLAARLREDPNVQSALMEATLRYRIDAAEEARERFRKAPSLRSDIANMQTPPSANNVPTHPVDVHP